MTWNEKSVGLIDLIYDSVDTDQGWMPTMVALAEALNSRGTHLFLQNQSTGEFIEDVMSGADADASVKYQRVAHTDPLLHLSMARPGAIVNDVDFYSDSFFKTTEVYNEVMKGYGGRFRVSSILPLNEELVAGLAILRDTTPGSFKKTDVDKIDFILPHITRALRLQRRLRKLEAEAHNIAAALDRLPTSAVIVSESLEIVCMNRQADRLLETTKALRVRRNKLTPAGSDQACALRKAITKAIGLANNTIETPLPPPQVVSIPRAGKLPLDVLAVPLKPRYSLRQNAGKNARVLLLIYDPDIRPTIEPELLERIFNLTSTEAFVAARLAEGHSINEIATERRCSTSTVRTHVKHIFQKTRTSRQGELVQLILTSPAISFG